MNVFSSCLIFISLLNPLFSNAVRYIGKTPDVNLPGNKVHDYQKGGMRNYDTQDKTFHRERYIDATGCQPSAGASPPSTRTCDQWFKMTDQGILCEATCDNPKFNKSVVRYLCTGRDTKTGLKGCTGCMSTAF
ncbi:hypothetical protein MJO29_013877 [Puccinia striiformis f. sp. tritici]|nr:hypothetical protein MJO29_013877 [Puccinia striiformis f. sp. tritici]